MKTLKEGDIFISLITNEKWDLMAGDILSYKKSDIFTVERTKRTLILKPTEVKYINPQSPPERPKSPRERYVERLGLWKELIETTQDYVRDIRTAVFHILQDNRDLIESRGDRIVDLYTNGDVVYVEVFQEHKSEDGGGQVVTFRIKNELILGSVHYKG